MISESNTKRRLEVCLNNHSAQKTEDDIAFCAHSNEEWERLRNLTRIDTATCENCSAAAIMISFHTAFSLMLAPEGFERASVLVLRRDPFFIALSAEKKQILTEMKQIGAIQCRNVHQRGSRSCTSVNASLMYTIPSARRLKKRYDATREAQIKLYRAARDLATLLESPLLEVQYTDLVQARGLPSNLERTLGLRDLSTGVNATSSRSYSKLISAVRTSPEDIRSTITNIDQLVNETIALSKEHDDKAPSSLLYLKFLNGEVRFEEPESWHGPLV